MLLITQTLSETDQGPPEDELPQSYCGDNERAHCFHDYMYITPILLL